MVCPSYSVVLSSVVKTSLRTLYTSEWGTLHSLFVPACDGSASLESCQVAFWSRARLQCNCIGYKLLSIVLCRTIIYKYIMSFQSSVAVSTCSEVDTGLQLVKYLNMALLLVKNRRVLVLFTVIARSQLVLFVFTTTNCTSPPPTTIRNEVLI